VDATIVANDMSLQEALIADRVLLLFAQKDALPKNNKALPKHK
jgi:hypothetical protein